MPDGRIGLIDYGATKRMSENERITACVLFVALARKDKDKLWQMAKLAGYKSKHMNPDVYYKLVQFGYDTWGKEVTGGQNVQQFMDDLKRQDPWYETPDNFVLASFMVRMLLFLLLLCCLLFVVRFMTYIFKSRWLHLFHFTSLTDYIRFFFFVHCCFFFTTKTTKYKVRPITGIDTWYEPSREM